MKKLTLSVGLLAGIMTSNAQDTLQYLISKNSLTEFKVGGGKTYHNIETFHLFVDSGDVLNLHLFDMKNRLRTIAITYSNGKVVYKTVDSKDNEFFFKGRAKIIVSRAKRFVRL